MAISRSSELSVNVLLIFDVFLNTIYFSALSSSFAAATKRSVVPFTTMYASLQLYKFDLRSFKPYILVAEY